MKLGSHIFPVMLYILQHSFIFKKYITIPQHKLFSLYISSYIYYLHKQTKYPVMVFLFFFFIWFFLMSVLQFSLRHFKCFISFLLVFKLYTCELLHFFFWLSYIDITHFLYKQILFPSVHHHFTEFWHFLHYLACLHISGVLKQNVHLQLL